ncbi:hypothetical protein BD310DRAFT_1043541 [Dichomitus squalens]|uniref:Uncharacterized protein n=1 Tax=Dichomitus squalens TaxID=114155 RepID=A0A4Q9P9W1_9APHY|nr:hypothetical protein BD310DRAFT_1043541 [Dichomitus squalens]
MCWKMPVTLFDLPAELWLMIKSYLEPWDLRTIVCLYLADSRFVVLYDWEEDPDKFWKLACWHNGIGQFPTDVDQDEGEPSWLGIALECIQSCGFCRHPYCGEALLKHNREHIQENEDYVEECSAMTFDEGPYTDANLTPNPVLSNVRFRPSTEFRQETYPLEEDAYLHRSDDLDCDVSERAYIGEHPIAARSFATATPISVILLLGVVTEDLPDEYALELERPVTVYDVLAMIRKSLDKRLPATDVANHLEFHWRCAEWNGWDVANASENLRTTRDVLSVCPIRSLELVELTISFSLR